MRNFAFRLDNLLKPRGTSAVPDTAPSGKIGKRIPLIIFPATPI